MIKLEEGGGEEFEKRNFLFERRNKREETKPEMERPQKSSKQKREEREKEKEKEKEEKEKKRREYFGPIIKPKITLTLLSLLWTILFMICICSFFVVITIQNQMRNPWQTSPSFPSAFRLPTVSSSSFFSFLSSSSFYSSLPTFFPSSFSSSFPSISSPPSLPYSLDLKIPPSDFPPDGWWTREIVKDYLSSHLNDSSLLFPSLYPPPPPCSSSKEAVGLVTSFDGIEYLTPLVALLNSTLFFNSEECLRMWVLITIHGDVSLDDASQAICFLQQIFWDQIQEGIISILIVHGDHLDPLIKITSNRQDLSSPSNFIRFWIPQILPEFVKTVLYIDADTLVIGKLKKLLDAVNGSGIGVFPHTNQYYRHFVRKSSHTIFPQLNLSDPSFNAGIMVINLTWWRLSRMSETLQSLLVMHKRYNLWVGGSQGPLLLSFYKSVSLLQKQWAISCLGCTLRNRPACATTEITKMRRKQERGLSGRWRKKGGKKGGKSSRKLLELEIEKDGDEDGDDFEDDEDGVKVISVKKEGKKKLSEEEIEKKRQNRIAREFYAARRRKPRRGFFNPEEESLEAILTAILEIDSHLKALKEEQEGRPEENKKGEREISFQWRKVSKKRRMKQKKELMRYEIDHLPYNTTVLHWNGKRKPWIAQYGGGEHCLPAVQIWSHFVDKKKVQQILQDFS